MNLMNIIWDLKITRYCIYRTDEIMYFYALLELDVIPIEIVFVIKFSFTLRMFVQGLCVR